jgi:hypothetical protein
VLSMDDKDSTESAQPDGQKGAISEKEIAIFELRKVLFPDKHLWELPSLFRNFICGSIMGNFLPNLYGLAKRVEKLLSPC